jgi:LmbE family N-acetylglucosaminyl deacetylase
MVKKVLVIVAHPDDEILGVGGAIKKHSKIGDEIYCLILGQGITSRGKSDKESINNLRQDSFRAGKIVGFKEIFFEEFPDQRFDSVDFLEVVKKIEEYIKKIGPSILYTHYYNDLNLDHQITSKAVITACRPCNKDCPKEILCFETLSSTEWQLIGKRFKPNIYVDIENEIEAKTLALTEYSSEIREYPHPRSVEGIQILAQYRGMECGKRYAEAFKLMRKVE